MPANGVHFPSECSVKVIVRSVCTLSNVANVYCN